LNPGSGEFLPPSLVRVLLPSLAPSASYVIVFITGQPEFFSAYLTFPCCLDSYSYSTKIWLEAQLHSASGVNIDFITGQSSSLLKTEVLAAIYRTAYYMLKMEPSLFFSRNSTKMKKV
jgi:hypothetical protein